MRGLNHQIIKFVALAQIFLAPEHLAIECKLEGVGQGWLGTRMATIYPVRFSREGVAASWFFNTVRHNPCPGGGACKWIFTHCKGNEFVVESKKYRGSYMYANVASAISHYSVNQDFACSSNAYRWKVWYDGCTDNYYLQNTYYGDWLDASDAGCGYAKGVADWMDHLWDAAAGLGVVR